MRTNDVFADPIALRATLLANVRELAQAIAGTLRVARALAASGRRVDLAGLEEPVGLLCAKSLDLPPDQGRQMRIVLIDLRRELDALLETLGPAEPG